MVREMSEVNLPACLFVGTAKAGTTTIEHALRAHPRVGVPRKETFYFDHDLMGNGDLPYPQQRQPGSIIRSEPEYRGLYTGLGTKTVVEVGTGYLYHHAVAIPRIKSVLGTGTRIGIVLRDPAERAWSSYMHFVKDAHEPLGFRESIEREAERKAAGWDFMWHHVEMGKYASQVEAYMNAFPNTRIFLFEDLRQDAEGFMRGVFDLVGVEPMDLPAVEARNRSGEPKYKALQRLITTENPIKKMVRPLIRMVVPQERRRRARKFMKEKNMTQVGGLQPADRIWLRDIYRADVERLSGTLGKDLFATWRW